MNKKFLITLVALLGCDQAIAAWTTTRFFFDSGKNVVVISLEQDSKTVKSELIALEDSIIEKMKGECAGSVAYRQPTEDYYQPVRQDWMGYPSSGGFHKSVRYKGVFVIDPGVDPIETVTQYLESRYISRLINGWDFQLFVKHEGRGWWKVFENTDDEYSRKFVIIENTPEAMEAFIRTNTLVCDNAQIANPADIFDANRWH